MEACIGLLGLLLICWLIASPFVILGLSNRVEALEKGLAKLRSDLPSLSPKPVASKGPRRIETVFPDEPVPEFEPAPKPEPKPQPQRRPAPKPTPERPRTPRPISPAERTGADAPTLKPEPKPEPRPQQKPEPKPQTPPKTTATPQRKPAPTPKSAPVRKPAAPAKSTAPKSNAPIGPDAPVELDDLPSAPTRKPRPKLNPEELLAGTWLTWIGAVAIIVGAGFFFRYAIQQGWIGPSLRVALGVLVGVGSLIGGVVAMKKDYGRFAQGLVGAGLGVLYFAFYASVKVYVPAVMPVELAFLGMIVATTAGITFAVVFDTQVPAVLGMIGGFLTPVMLSTGSGEMWVLFPYLLVLDIGLLCAATYRHWPGVNLFAFFATALTWAAWIERYLTPELRGDAVLLMIPFGVLFTLLGVWHHLVKKSPPTQSDFPIIFGTPSLLLTGLFTVLGTANEPWFAPIAAILAACYALLAILAYIDDGTHDAITVSWAFVSIILLAIAVPLQFDGHFVPIAWAIQTLALYEIAHRFKMPKIGVSAAIMLTLVLGCVGIYAGKTFYSPETFSPAWRDIFLLDRPATVQPNWRPLLHSRFFTSLTVIGVLVAMAWRNVVWTRHRTDGGIAPLTDNNPITVLAGLASGVTLLTMLTETYDIWYRLSGFVPTFVAALAIELALVTLLLTALGRLTKLRELPQIGLVSFAIITLLLGVQLFLTIDLSPTQWQAELEAGTIASAWRLPVVNPRGLGFLVPLLCGAVCLKLLHVRSTADDTSAADGKPHPLAKLSYLLFVFGTWVGFFFLTSELIAFHAIRGAGPVADLRLTLAWVAYLTLVLIAGWLKNNVDVSHSATAIAAFTAVKLFTHDVPRMHTPTLFAWVAAATAVAGLIVIIVGLAKSHRALTRSALTFYAASTFLLVLQTIGTGVITPDRWSDFLANSASAAQWQRVLINPRGSGFLAMLISTGVALTLLKGRVGLHVSAESERNVLTHSLFTTLSRPLLLLGVVAGFGLLTTEVAAFYSIRGSVLLGGRLLTFSWLAYATAVLITGLVKRRDELNIAAAVIFALGIGKGLLYDLTRQHVPTHLSALSAELGLLGVAIVLTACVVRSRSVARSALLFPSAAALLLTAQTVLTCVRSPEAWTILFASDAGWTSWELLCASPSGLGFLTVMLSTALMGALLKLRSELDPSTASVRLSADPLRAKASQILGLTAAWIGCCYLTSEVFAYRAVHELATSGGLILTLGWIVYATLMLILGIARRFPELRVAALALFLVTTAKVFLGDIWYLHVTIRTFAFMALGVALLFVSWLYRRHRDWIEGFIGREDDPDHDSEAASPDTEADESHVGEYSRSR